MFKSMKRSYNIAYVVGVSTLLTSTTQDQPGGKTRQEVVSVYLLNTCKRRNVAT